MQEQIVIKKNEFDCIIFPKKILPVIYFILIKKLKRRKINFEVESLIYIKLKWRNLLESDETKNVMKESWKDIQINIEEL